MSAQVVSIFWWAFGTLGVGGLIACWFIFPGVSQLVLQAVVKLFQFVLSYRIGCALIAAVLAALIADQHRHRYDDEQFAKRVAAFEAAQDARDRRIADKTREMVWKEIANATAENAKTDSNVKEFTDALPPPAPTGNPFIVGADADRLCKIAGQTQCGPSANKGMPAARRASGSSGDKPKIRLPSLIRSGTWTDQKGQ